MITNAKTSIAGNEFANAFWGASFKLNLQSAIYNLLAYNNRMANTQTVPLRETFFPRLNARWNRIQVGGGRLLMQREGLRLLSVGADRTRYTDAQIDDYGKLPRRQFPWRPPLRMTVRARASGPLLGTAGFGFWNNPFSPFGGFPALPSAVWFFHASPPSDLPLAVGVSGTGWKCAMIDATTSSALRWAPLAPPVLLLNRLPALASHIWPHVQHSLAIAEAPLPALDANWQTYTIEWLPQAVRFLRGDDTLLETPFAPRGPLGFVAWVDNQYAIATPQGRFGWGLLDAAGAQWLDLQRITIEPLGTSHK